VVPTLAPWPSPEGDDERARAAVSSRGRIKVLSGGSLHVVGFAGRDTSSRVTPPPPVSKTGTARPCWPDLQTCFAADRRRLADPDGADKGDLVLAPEEQIG